MTAHGIYNARLNGSRVGDHVLPPGWTSYHHRLAYQTLDVTSLLSVGTNTLEMTVAEGWYCGKLGWSGGHYNIYGVKVGLIALLIYDLDDGTKHYVGTEESWRWAHSPFITAGLYDGVCYDANEAINEYTHWQEVSIEPLSDNLVAFDGPPIRRQQELKLVNIFKSPSGNTIVDMGQNMVGWVKVNVTGPRTTRSHLASPKYLRMANLVRDRSEQPGQPIH